MCWEVESEHLQVEGEVVRTLRRNHDWNRWCTAQCAVWSAAPRLRLRRLAGSPAATKHHQATRQHQNRHLFSVLVTASALRWNSATSEVGFLVRDLCADTDGWGYVKNTQMVFRNMWVIFHLMCYSTKQHFPFTQVRQWGKPSGTLFPSKVLSGFYPFIKIVVFSPS